MCSKRLTASVVISSRNRKEELLRAIQSCIKQDESPEIVLIDDGSSDGTYEAVKRNFPNVILVRHEASIGYIASRNEGARLASGTIVFSIDDDAEFVSPSTVSQTLKDFSDERVAAVAIPYIEPQSSTRVHQSSSDRQGIVLTHSFKGTAYAIRRDVFLALGGFREPLTHQGEESDFCIRLLNFGYFVRLGNADPIVHHESPKRSLDRMDYYGCRNAVLFVWQNTPARYVLPLFGGTVLRCILFSLAPRRLLIRLSGICAGVLAIWRTDREPVDDLSFCLFRKLRRGPFTLEEITPSRCRKCFFSTKP